MTDANRNYQRGLLGDIGNLYQANNANGMNSINQRSNMMNQIGQNKYSQIGAQSNLNQNILGNNRNVTSDLLNINGTQYGQQLDAIRNQGNAAQTIFGNTSGVNQTNAGIEQYLAGEAGYPMDLTTAAINSGICTRNTSVLTSRSCSKRSA